MKKRYYVGHCVKSAELFANVSIVNEKRKDSIRQLNSLSIEIVFMKPFTYKQLQDQGINLPYYTRTGKKWIFNIHDRDQLIPELNRLNSLGFKIPEPKHNLEIHKLVAEWV